MNMNYFKKFVNENFYMNNLKVFKNNDFGSVRTIIIEGEPFNTIKQISKCKNI